MPASLDPRAPNVVASIHSDEDLALACRGIPPGTADILEWRLDALTAASGAGLADALQATSLPALFTARRRDEGGHHDWSSEADRIAAVQAHALHAHWIDMEARSLRESREWRDAAAGWRAMGIELIVSYHDFVGVPDGGVLRDLADLAAAHGATVLKIAATPADLDEVHALGKVFTLPGAFHRSVMAMGRFGLASRLLFAAAGSVLNYGYLLQPSVPGQWPAAELRRLLGEHRAAIERA